MSASIFIPRAHDDFTRIRIREAMTKIFSTILNSNRELLSLHEATAILKPKSETYKGMKMVPINRIVGSEGRYRDFNRKFLPKHDNMRSRWERIDIAHYEHKILPPVHLYEIGGVYFIRDGNHRVSVAKTNKVEFIDAEVIALSSSLELNPNMTMEDIKRAVIELEKKLFYEKTHLDKLRSRHGIEFTAPGRYDEMLAHINGHKYYMNLEREEEIRFEEGIVSWYDHVYNPIVQVICVEKLLERFPGRTVSDLYVWIVKHWDLLKQKYGQTYSLVHAVRDYSERYRNRGWWAFIKALFTRVTGKRKGSAPCG